MTTVKPSQEKVESLSETPGEEFEEGVEEVSPIEMIEMLSDDLSLALTALKKIARLDPNKGSVNSNNKNFGKRHQQKLTEARQTALDALLQIKENR